MKRFNPFQSGSFISNLVQFFADDGHLAPQKAIASLLELIKQWNKTGYPCDILFRIQTKQLMESENLTSEETHSTYVPRPYGC